MGTRLEPRQSEFRAIILSHYSVFHGLRPELDDLFRNDTGKKIYNVIEIFSSSGSPYPPSEIVKA